MDYRSLHRISNSDLTEFKNRIFGYRPYQPAGALSFGSALHELILEPKTQTDWPPTVDRKLIETLATQLQADSFCRWALRFSRKETVQLWEDPVTGLLLKSKLDLVHRNRLVIDLKSTSQRTHADFLKSLSTYDYDRQAAFYLDSIQARRFMFIGVQKIKPYNISIVEPSPGFLETGRRKYRALLREWKKRDQLAQPFTPSTWNEEPVLTPATLCC